MNQEYIQNNTMPAKKPTVRRRFFLEAWLIMMVLFAGYLMVSLISFNPSDPSWSQTAWHEPIHNLGGGVGAWLADMLFFIFGIVAYVIPLLGVTFCQIVLRHKKKSNEPFDYFFISLRLIGSLALVLSACSLAALSIDDLYYFPSGGVIGSLFGNLMLLNFNSTAGTVCLLFIWGAGLTLFTGWSWLLIAEKIGWVVLNGLHFICDYRHKKGYRHQSAELAVSPTAIEQTTITDDDRLFSLSSSAKNEISSEIKEIKEINEAKEVKEEEPSACFLDEPPLTSETSLTDEANKAKLPSIEFFTAPKENIENAPVAQSDEATLSSDNTKMADEAVASVPETLPDTLIHPFLMRNDSPLVKPTTPLPTLDLLSSPSSEKPQVDREALKQTALLVETRLADYRVKAKVVGISPGPVITRFDLDLAPGVKAARISSLSRDLARSLSAIAVRVVEVIPGKPYVGLELPNPYRQTVYLREVLDCPVFRETRSPLAMVLGKDIAGQPVVADLAQMPHLLVAGTTGSGKSVGVNAMILSILYKATPDEVRFIMIDPKMLELSVYEGIPHLLTQVVTDMKDAANALRWCVAEMERRYKLMSALGVRNLANYNERVLQAENMGRPIPDPFWKPKESMGLSPPMLEKLPYIVVMVDEFADLMMTVGKKVEELIARLAQKARAAGIHLVLATQRPSVDVITGLIKANIPTRIAFTVSSKIDSRTILDQAGAESLLGMGDMLYMAPNSSIPIRIHGAFVRDQEVHAVVNDWKARGRPQYIENILSESEENEGGNSAGGEEPLDPLFDQAVNFVLEKRRASISAVQRQFRIGYNRAARIIEQMEAQQIVSAPNHSGNREVLAPEG